MPGGVGGLANAGETSLVRDRTVKLRSLEGSNPTSNHYRPEPSTTRNLLIN